MPYLALLGTAIVLTLICFLMRRSDKRKKIHAEENDKEMGVERLSAEPSIVNESMLKPSVHTSQEPGSARSPSGTADNPLVTPRLRHES